MSSPTDHPTFLKLHGLAGVGDAIRYSLEFHLWAKDSGAEQDPKLLALADQIHAVRDGLIKFYESLPPVRFNSIDGYKDAEGNYSLSLDLAGLRDFANHRDELHHGNNTLATILRKAGVCPKGCSFDPESSCLYIYFETEASAIEFNRRLNLFLDAASKGDQKLSAIKINGREKLAQPKRTKK